MTADRTVPVPTSVLTSTVGSGRSTVAAEINGTLSDVDVPDAGAGRGHRAQARVGGDRTGRPRRAKIAVELEQEVEAWLLALSDELSGRAERYIDLLVDDGVHLDEPSTRQLRGKLRELRFHLGRR